MSIKLRKKAEELHRTEELLDGSSLSGQLNHRQLALLQNALKNPGQTYTVTSHMNSHRVARQTARTDLQELSSRFDLLISGGSARKAVFTAPADLRDRIFRQCS